MPDELDRAQARTEAETERALAARPRFAGESARECVECGNDIPLARQEALPGVTTCVACTEVAEAQR